MIRESVSWAGRKAVSALSWTCRKGWGHRREAAEVAKNVAVAGAGSAVKLGEVVHDLVSLGVYRKKELAELESELRDRAERYREVLKDPKFRLDAGIIGGTLVSDIIAGGATPSSDVVEAFELAYPRHAAEMSFSEAVAAQDTDQALLGLISGIKGKLFEMKYVDDLNAGLLPDGYTAALAESATQPGWDIAIAGPEGEVVEVLQLKATESLSYVQEAFDRYPDVDVVTTSELQSQLMLHAVESGDAQIIASGISNEELTALVEEAIDAPDLPDLGIPAVGLALIAFTTYSETDIGIYRRSYQFGKRGTMAVLAYSTAAALSGLSAPWWIAIGGAMGVRWVTDRGKSKRTQHAHLSELLRSSDDVIRRFESLALR
jgi:hypothetical protein